MKNITILACVNADGNKMAPLCVVKGNSKGTVWTYQEKAWMCDILGEMWWRGIFLKQCGPKRSQLLIIDSHGSHETIRLFEEAMDEKIFVPALPPQAMGSECVRFILLCL